MFGNSIEYVQQYNTGSYLEEELKEKRDERKTEKNEKKEKKEENEINKKMKWMFKGLKITESQENKQ